MNIGTQTETEHANITNKKQNSVATQCNLLDAPPLELLPSGSLDDSNTEPEEADLDTSFHVSQDEYSTE